MRPIPKKPTILLFFSPLLLVSLASSTIETFSRVVESLSLDETRTARKVKRAALFYTYEPSDCAGQGARCHEKQRREEKRNTITPDRRRRYQRYEGGGGEGRWLKDRLDDFLRRHPRNTGIGEHENSCNQFSPALAHEPHRVMQYNMWKRASPSNPMSSHPIP